MVKNWDIIRAILLRLESSETANTTLNSNDIPGYPEQEVAYNMRLLNEAGFIAANILDSNTGGGRIAAALARRLTNSGHELLDTMRADSVWGKVKDTFKTKGVEMSFELVIAVGKRVAESLLFS